MISVTHPPGMDAIWAYAASVVFGDILGVDYRAQAGCREDVSITVEGSSGAVVMPAVFVGLLQKHGVSSRALPELPLATVPLAGLLPEAVLRRLNRVPILYGRTSGDSCCDRRGDSCIYLGLDVLGSAAYMLSRFEEMVGMPRDEHGRTVVSELPSFKAGIYGIPIIDVYVECLWRTMLLQWPSLHRRAREYSLIVSHDVDFVYAAGRNPLVLARRTAHDILARGDAGLAVRRLRSAMCKDYRNDPFNTFDYLMDVSDVCGVRSEFYFMNPSSRHRLDGDYTMSHPVALDAARKVLRRDHRLGLHASYLTGGSSNLLSKEVESLVDLGLMRSGSVLCRSHFLRWLDSRSWCACEDAGVTSDSSLGSSQHIGFRCGVANAFRTFDVHSMRSLRVIEQPLVLMDHAILDSHPHGRQPLLEAAAGAVWWCRAVGGTMTVLWHNSAVAGSQERRVYEELMAIAA